MGWAGFGRSEHRVPKGYAFVISLSAISTMFFSSFTHLGIVWDEATQINFIDSLFHNFYIAPIVFGKLLPLSRPLFSFTAANWSHVILSHWTTSRWKPMSNMHWWETAVDNPTPVCKYPNSYPFLMSHVLSYSKVFEGRYKQNYFNSAFWLKFMCFIRLLVCDYHLPKQYFDLCFTSRQEFVWNSFIHTRS